MNSSPYMPLQSDHNSMTKYKYWSSLRSMQKEYLLTTPTATIINLKEFYEYVEDKYGIRVIDSGAGLDPNYTIIDKNKHLIYLLKHMS